MIVQRHRLFNRYGAYTAEASEIVELVTSVIKKLLSDYPTVDRNDLQMVTLEAISMELSLERILEGTRLRREERALSGSQNTE